jgi:hypothetical protein
MFLAGAGSTWGKFWNFVRDARTEQAIVVKGLCAVPPILFGDVVFKSLMFNATFNCENGVFI